MRLISILSPCNIFNISITIQCYESAFINCVHFLTIKLRNLFRLHNLLFHNILNIQYYKIKKWHFLHLRIYSVIKFKNYKFVNML